MNGTIRPIATAMDVSGLNSSDPAKRSYFGLWKQMPSLFGESLLTIQVRKASTAPFFETKASTSAQTLSDKLTPLLISRGLVKGVIPTSMRMQSGQQMLASAFFEPGGADADKPKAGYSYSKV